MDSRPTVIYTPYNSRAANGAAGATATADIGMAIAHGLVDSSGSSTSVSIAFTIVSYVIYISVAFLLYKLNDSSTYGFSGNPNTYRFGYGFVGLGLLMSVIGIIVFSTAKNSNVCPTTAVTAEVAEQLSAHITQEKIKNAQTWMFITMSPILGSVFILVVSIIILALIAGSGGRY
jgi:hypothetical protein